MGYKQLNLSTMQFEKEEDEQVKAVFKVATTQLARRIE